MNKKRRNYTGMSNSPWFRKACAGADLRKPEYKKNLDDYENEEFCNKDFDNAEFITIRQ